MERLAAALAEAESIYRTMRDLGEEGDQASKDELIRQRSLYAMQMLEIIQALKTDPKLVGDPKLAAEFQRRFFSMRRMLGEHQAKWRLSAIAADREGYLASANALSREQDGFYHWANTHYPRD